MDDCPVFNKSLINEAILRKFLDEHQGGLNNSQTSVRWKLWTENEKIKLESIPYHEFYVDPILYMGIL